MVIAWDCMCLPHRGFLGWRLALSSFRASTFVGFGGADPVSPNSLSSAVLSVLSVTSQVRGLFFLLGFVSFGGDLLGCGPTCPSGSV